MPRQTRDVAVVGDLETERRGQRKMTGREARLQRPRQQLRSGIVRKISKYESSWMVMSDPNGRSTVDDDNI
jgi:hypothetical protein